MRIHSTQSPSSTQSDKKEKTTPPSALVVQEVLAKAPKEVQSLRDLKQRPPIPISSSGTLLSPQAPKAPTPASLRKKERRKEQHQRKIQREKAEKKKQQETKRASLASKEIVPSLSKEEIQSSLPQEVIPRPTPPPSNLPLPPSQPPTAQKKTLSEKIGDAYTTLTTSKAPWVNVAVVISAVVFGLLTAFGYLCSKGYFPPAFLGGIIGCSCVTLGCGIILVGCGILIYKRWAMISKMFS